MKIDTSAKGRKPAWTTAAADLAKAAAAAVPVLITGQPGASMVAMGAAMPAIIDAALALSSHSKPSLGSSAWSMVKAAYAAGIVRFISTAPLDRRPTGVELQSLVETLVIRLELLLEENTQELSPEVFLSPLRLPAFRRMARDITHEMRLYTLDNPIANGRKLFEECLIEGFLDCRNARPDEFAKVEQSFRGAFADGYDKYRSLTRHYNFLLNSFSLKPVFGQEDEGITLSDLYVRQRALWVSRERHEGHVQEDDGPAELVGSDFFRESDKDPHKWRYLFHVDDLHATIWTWLRERDCSEAIRVIAGGPGSGKSTLARALAIEAIDSEEFDVLFVPLQEIEAVGSFPVRVENLLRSRTDLGLDRHPDALNWLGQSETTGSSPVRPLLLICDGLDEIAPPGSAEAATVTADFVQALSSWVYARNSGGFHVCALVLGRTISAQEAFHKLGIGHHALVRVAGFLPVTGTDEWEKAKRHSCTVDLAQLAEKDQRQEYWLNWCSAKAIADQSLPVALEANNAPGRALQELTAEPLLLYLLIWTGYLGQQWEKAASNRNHVYEEIFKQIYQRKWGLSAPRVTGNKQRGGHPATDDVSEDDFFLLQEALGLASWGTGGRTVNVAAFDAMLKVYLNEDKYEDISDSVASSLKSVALQGYTRSVGGDAAGYEFVHKTIGEYLIARGLATTLTTALDEVRERSSPGRCAKAAAKLAAIMRYGVLKPEIARFFVDELRMRLRSAKIARRELEWHFLPVMNWLLQNGFSFSPEPGGQTEMVYARADQSDQRIWDVVWSAFQAIAHISYPWRTMGINHDEAWEVGPVRLDWPNPQSFISLFARLSSRSHVAETGRIPTFDYLDIRGQAVTDYTFGSVIFNESSNEGSFRPLIWLPISMRACRLDGLFFYGANLREAHLNLSSLVETVFSGARLDRAILQKANCRSAVFVDASLNFVDAHEANFTGANLSGTKFKSAQLQETDLSEAKFDPRVREGGLTIFANASLERAKVQNTDLGQSILFRCKVDGADFTGADLTKCHIVDTDFRKTILEENQSELKKNSARKSKGGPNRTQTILVMDDEEIAAEKLAFNGRAPLPRGKSKKKS
ncbi:pentapeptide repeat-containing protein [Hoeflea alexandrii]|uniref:pentapeptide repeat-containing protein n=1 Tax=Hoeflea alexandrii TaxID=288436 RepID=UPI0022AE8EED|nr:pentapeptide repeat-containing protein [Hoeflea alexandrii]MCZ4290547.1 pentapeptide repeat-containing protein [Hoeflea alexandrii]